MSLLPHIHQRFNADTCHAYIHTLRWTDRPLHCPRCQSHAVSPWGNYHYRPRLKRYWCHGCQRTFNDLTHTLFAQSQRSLPHWILATFLLCLPCSSRRMARELGVHIRTSYRWCWWLRNVALSYETDRHLEGTIEADELYQRYGNDLPENGPLGTTGQKPCTLVDRVTVDFKGFFYLLQGLAKNYCLWPDDNLFAPITGEPPHGLD
jgi:transposase-like protein